LEVEETFANQCKCRAEAVNPWLREGSCNRRKNESLDARGLLHFYRSALLRVYVARVETGILFEDNRPHLATMDPQGVALALTDNQYNTSKVRA